MTTVDDRPTAEQETAQQKVAERNSPIVSAAAITSEGAQELQPRSMISQQVIMRDAGSVLRMSESAAAALADVAMDAQEDQTMIINMGPQHPSTHGVLRLMLELQGETVLRCKPIIGYLHTGMEKTGETLSFMQGGTNVTRMDYLSPLNNELVFSLATEKLLGIDGDVPERAQWMRMLLSELNRMSSHLLFMATNGMDLGAVSMMLYGWREREQVLRFFQKVTGLRMNHNFIRPGGVAADLPAGWRDDVLALLDMLPDRLAEYEVLMTGQPIFRERLQGVGVITQSEAIALAATGPILRSTGLAFDLRKDLPYLNYNEVEFDVVVGVHGDAYDRYAIRLQESGSRCVLCVRYSTRCLAVTIAFRTKGHPATARANRRIHGSPHPPLQDFHRGFQSARG